MAEEETEEVITTTAVFRTEDGAVVVDAGVADEAEVAIAARNAAGTLPTPDLTAPATMPVVEGTTVEEAEGIIPAMTASIQSARLLRLYLGKQ